jgi:hypothetical protein
LGFPSGLWLGLFPSWDAGTEGLMTPFERNDITWIIIASIIVLTVWQVH